jgi:hypothetical protein
MGVARDGEAYSPSRCAILPGEKLGPDRHRHVRCHRKVRYRRITDRRCAEKDGPFSTPNRTVRTPNIPLKSWGQTGRKFAARGLLLRGSGSTSKLNWSPSIKVKTPAACTSRIWKNTLPPSGLDKNP